MTHRHPHPDRRLPLIAAFLTLALACESDPATETLPPPCVVSETLSIGSLAVELEAEPGVVRGVDLDDHDSALTDREGCFEEDWDDPDGSRVDNQFAILAPTLEAAFDSDLRFFFADNELTLAVERRGDGVCAAVGVALNGGPMRAAEWNGSTLRAYHLGDVPLRLTLPEASATVTLHDAAARLTLTTAERVATIVVSGGLDVDELAAVTDEALVGAGAEIFRDAFERLADLAPDELGTCTRISIGFEADPPDPPRP